MNRKFRQVVESIERLISLPIRVFPRRKEVAVVRLDALGDFVVWLAAARHLRDVYPNDHIVLYVGRSLVDLASEIDYWDEIVPIDRRYLNPKRPSRRLLLLLKVRRRRYRLVVQPTFSRQYFYGDALIRASAAPVKIGYDGDMANISSDQKRVSDSWYTKLVSSIDSDNSEYHRNKHFMQVLGARIREERLADLPQRDTELSRMLSTLDYIAVAPGSSVRNRNWPVHRFGQIGKNYSTMHGCQVVVCGGVDERDLCQEVCEAIGETAINLCGMTTHVDLIQLIRGARLLLSNETSYAHIAAAVGTRSIVVLGGGHFGRFMPYPSINACQGRLPVPAYEQLDCYGCNWHCIYSLEHGAPFPCIDLVTEKSVWDKLAAVEM